MALTVERLATGKQLVKDSAEREKVGISDGLVRLSVGIEALEDLLADLDAAFKRAGLASLNSPKG